MSQKELWERHRAVMPSWVALYYDEPIALVSGDGCRVVDADGNLYLDMFAGILTTMSGHNVPEVIDAIHSQSGKILHSSTLYLIEPAIELAEEIARLAPVDDPKVFLVNSGTEANEVALMLATAYRRSNQIIALRNSYHGRSFAAVAATGNRGWSPSSLTPVNVTYAQGVYRYRSPYRDLDDDAYITACADDLRDVITTTTAGDVACMLAEPIQGVGGFATPPDGLFGAMKEVLDEYGILFVSDEVQTGWGRTGDHFWGIDAHGVRPDMITFAKGLGNGMAIGGVVARSDIMDCLPANSISTFGGNPVSASAALANLHYAVANDLQGNALRMGRILMDDLRAVAQEVLGVGDVRGKGLMIGVELVVPGTMTPDPAAASAIMEEAKRRGVLIGKGGLFGNVLRIAPPMSISEAETREGSDVLRESIRAVLQR